MSDPIASPSTSKETSLITIKSEELPAKSSTNTTISMKTASSNPGLGTLGNTTGDGDDHDNHQKDNTGSNWSKFRLLLWKDIKLSMRKPFCFGIELLCMILFVAGLGGLLFRFFANVKDHMDRVIYDPFCIVPIHKPHFCVDQPFLEDELYSTDEHDIRKYILIYSPGNNTAIQEIMEPFKSDFKEVKEFKDAKQMEAYYDTQGADSVFAGVQFDDSLFNGKDFGGKTIDLCLRFVDIWRPFDLYPGHHWPGYTSKGRAKNYAFVDIWRPFDLYPGHHWPGYTSKGRAKNYAFVDIWRPFDLYPGHHWPGYTLKGRATNYA